MNTNNEWVKVTSIDQLRPGMDVEWRRSATDVDKLRVVSTASRETVNFASRETVKFMVAATTQIGTKVGTEFNAYFLDSVNRFAYIRRSDSLPWEGTADEALKLFGDRLIGGTWQFISFPEHTVFTITGLRLGFHVFGNKERGCPRDLPVRILTLGPQSSAELVGKQPVAVAKEEPPIKPVCRECASGNKSPGIRHRLSCSLRVDVFVDGIPTKSRLKETLQGGIGRPIGIGINRPLRGGESAVVLGTWDWADLICENE